MAFLPKGEFLLASLNLISLSTTIPVRSIRPRAMCPAAMVRHLQRMTPQERKPPKGGFLSYTASDGATKSEALSDTEFVTTAGAARRCRAVAAAHSELGADAVIADLGIVGVQRRAL